MCELPSYLLKTKISYFCSFNFLPKVSKMYYHFSNCSNILIQVLFTAELNMNEMKLFLSHPWIIHCPLKFHILPRKKLRAKLTRKFDTSCNMQDCTTFQAQKFLLLSCRKTALLSKQSLWYLLTSLMLQLFFTQSLLLFLLFPSKEAIFSAKTCLP